MNPISHSKYNRQIHLNVTMNRPYKLLTWSTAPAEHTAVVFKSTTLAECFKNLILPVCRIIFFFEEINFGRKTIRELHMYKVTRQLTFLNSVSSLLLSCCLDVPCPRLCPLPRGLDGPGPCSYYTNCYILIA